MRKHWFKAKLYGWGWYPVTWQGWFITLAYIASLLYLALFLETSAYTTNEVIILLVIPASIFTALLILVCYLTGEKPRWRWGK